MKVGWRLLPIAAAALYAALAYAAGGRPDDGWYVIAAFAVVFVSVFGSARSAEPLEEPEKVHIDSR